MTLEERLENLRSLYNVLRMSVMSRGRGNGKTILVVCAGAVADAIAILQEQVPRLLTVEELFALPFGSVVWEENRFLEDDGGTSSTAAVVEGQGEDDSEDPDALQPLMRDDRGKGKGLAALVNIDGAPVYLHQRMLQRDHFDSGFQVRYWSAKPTPEQRRAAPWP